MSTLRVTSACEICGGPGLTAPENAWYPTVHVDPKICSHYLQIGELARHETAATIAAEAAHKRADAKRAARLAAEAKEAPNQKSVFRPLDVAAEKARLSRLGEAIAAVRRRATGEAA
jgi:hypothetical protein